MVVADCVLGILYWQRVHRDSFILDAPLLAVQGLIYVCMGLCLFTVIGVRGVYAEYMASSGNN